MNFWFPDDGSVTKINSFETEWLNVDIFDTIVVSTYKSYRNWPYEKIQFILEWNKSASIQSSTKNNRRIPGKYGDRCGLISLATGNDEDQFATTDLM